MSKSQWFTTSERSLIVVHNHMASRLKAAKRLVISKGYMMKTYDYINHLRRESDRIGIRRVISMLLKERSSPIIHVPRYHKYKELIMYCDFILEYLDSVDKAELILLAHECCKILNIGHELGCAIDTSIKNMCR